MTGVQTCALPISVLDLVTTLETGRPLSAGGLTLLPLLAPGPGPATAGPQPEPYLLYQQAHDAGVVSIQETSESGSVGELRVENRANRPVLLVEGEVLLGMKQTRVLNVSILVGPMSVLDVPVSCVEAGRWHPVSVEAIGKARIHLSPGVRATKTVTVARSMRSTRSFASDQAAVWAGVDRVLERHRANAPSRSYADLELAGQGATGIAVAIEPEARQVGVIACVGGRAVCADCFETPGTLQALWSGLLASYLAEAEAQDVAPLKPLNARAGQAAVRWFRTIASGSAGAGPELGLGSHVTVVAPGIEAAALVHDGRVLHLSAFPAHAASTATRFVRPSRRHS